jgi:hypothetical protein
MSDDDANRTETPDERHPAEHARERERRQLIDADVAAPVNAAAALDVLTSRRPDSPENGRPPGDAREPRSREPEHDEG